MDGGAPKRRRAVEEEAFVYSYDDDTYEPYKPLKERRRDAMARLNFRSRAVPQQEDTPRAEAPRKAAPTLLHEAQALRAQGKEMTREEREAEEAQRILEAHAARKKLVSHAELAHGIRYTEPLRRSWTPPHFVRTRSTDTNEWLREQHHVLAEGADLPPLIAHFRDMKLPPCVLTYLEAMGIRHPTPIQMQGLPTALLGRDMIGIASTGSGKTITFSLPLVLYAAEAERRLAFDASDGPLGLIVCPSRELARQTYDSIVALGAALERGGYVRIRVLLCIGGISMADQAQTLQTGFHIVVATPGRLQDMLEQRRFTLASCTYLCLDEADKMLEGTFEEPVRHIINFFTVRLLSFAYAAPAPNAALFGHDAEKSAGLCGAVAGPAGGGERGPGRCREPGRDPGGGVCAAGGEAGTVAGSVAKDSTACDGV